MENMGKLVRWLALFAAITVLTAIFEPLVVSKLQELGWYDNPKGALGPIVNWLERLIGDAAFPWVAAGIIGFAIGVFIDWFARKVDRSKPTKQERFAELSTQLSVVKYDLMNMLRVQKDRKSRRINPEWDLDVISNLNSLMHSIRKTGIYAPKLEDFAEKDVIQLGTDLAVYMTMIQPLSQNDHYEEAKSQAKLFVQRFTEDESPAPQLPQNTG